MDSKRVDKLCTNSDDQSIRLPEKTQKAQPTAAYMQPTEKALHSLSQFLIDAALKDDTNNKPGDQVNAIITTNSGKYISNTFSGKNLPCLEVQVGPDCNSTIKIATCLDSGCSITTISEALFNHLPHKENICITPTQREIQAANEEPLLIIGMADIVYTFTSDNNKTMSITIPTAIVRGKLNIDSFLGFDLMQGKYFYALSKTHLFLTNGPSNNPILSPALNDIFSIPYYTCNSRPDPHINKHDSCNAIVNNSSICNQLILNTSPDNNISISSVISTQPLPLITTRQAQANKICSIPINNKKVDATASVLHSPNQARIVISKHLANKEPAVITAKTQLLNRQSAITSIQTKAITLKLYDPKQANFQSSVYPNKQVIKGSIVDLESAGSINQDNPITTKTLQCAQMRMNYPYFKNLYAYHKQVKQDLPFFMSNNIFSRQHKRGNTQVCLPDLLRPSFTNQMHFSLFGTHRTADLFARNFIRNYFSKAQHETSNTRQITDPRPKTMQVINIIFKAICSLSKYSILKPKKSNTTKDLLNCSKECISKPLMSPLSIRYDRESGCTKPELAKDFVAAHKLRELFTTEHSPKTNSLYKALVNQIKEPVPINSLKKVTSWDTTLPSNIQTVKNIPLKNDINPAIAPFETSTTRKTKSLAFSNTIAPHVYLPSFKRWLLEYHRQIQHKQEENRRQNETFMNQHRQKRSSSIGQVALIRDNVTKAKASCETPLTGPLLVINILDHGNSAEFESLANGRRQKVHFNNMVPFTFTSFLTRLNEPCETLNTSKK